MKPHEPVVEKEEAETKTAASLLESGYSIHRQSSVLTAASEKIRMTLPVIDPHYLVAPRTSVAEF